MKKFTWSNLRAEILRHEGNMLRDLCKMVTRGNMMLIDPIRRINDWM